jgi:hypothetical protein
MVGKNFILCVFTFTSQNNILCHFPQFDHLDDPKLGTWKGIHPIIELSHQTYDKGISLTKKAMRQIEKRLERDPLLPKWDILIRPA